MKRSFINKKTGAEARVIAMYLDSDGVMQVDGYDTVEDLMDDYAAYEEYNPPKEPLIKDEKIRKAVRAWADGNMATRVQYDAFWRGFRHNNSTITVLEDLPFEDGKIYSIAELCGEEE